MSTTAASDPRSNRKSGTSAPHTGWENTGVTHPTPAYRPLSETVRRVLDGETANVDASRDAFTVVLGFLQTGRGYADIRTAAFHDQAPGLRHYRTVASKRGIGAAQRKIHAEIRRARVYIERHPAAHDIHTIRARLIEIADFLDGHPARFKGKAGTTDQLVLTNLIKVGLEAGRLRVSASCRQLSERTGLTANTVSRSLTRLRSNGEFLSRVERDRGPNAATYQLRLPDPDVGIDIDDGDFRRSTLSTLADLDDAFASTNLGPGPGCTFALLRADQPLSVRELQARRSRSASTIQRHLRRLREAGLVDRVNGGYVRSGHDAAATRAVREVRQQLHSGQRAAFREWLELGCRPPPLS